MFNQLVTKKCQDPCTSRLGCWSNTDTRKDAKDASINEQALIRSDLIAKLAELELRWQSNRTPEEELRRQGPNTGFSSGRKRKRKRQRKKQK